MSSSQPAINTLQDSERASWQTYSAFSSPSLFLLNKSVLLFTWKQLWALLLTGVPFDLITVALVPTVLWKYTKSETGPITHNLFVNLVPNFVSAQTASCAISAPRQAREQGCKTYFTKTPTNTPATTTINHQEISTWYPPFDTTTKRPRNSHQGHKNVRPKKLQNRPGTNRPTHPTAPT